MCCRLFREIYCRYIDRMKAEVSTAGKALQRSVMWDSRRTPSWQQRGLGGSQLSCTPLSCQAALSQLLSPSPWEHSFLQHASSGHSTQKLARIYLLMQWFCLTAPSFSAGKEASVVIGEGFGVTTWPEAFCSRKILGYWSWLLPWI